LIYGLNIEALSRVILPGARFLMLLAARGNVGRMPTQKGFSGQISLTLPAGFVSLDKRYPVAPRRGAVCFTGLKSPVCHALS
jgi:hypothetical protein